MILKFHKHPQNWRHIVFHLYAKIVPLRIERAENGGRMDVHHVATCPRKYVIQRHGAIVVQPPKNSPLGRAVSSELFLDFWWPCPKRNDEKSAEVCWLDWRENWFLLEDLFGRYTITNPCKSMLCSPRKIFSMKSYGENYWVICCNTTINKIEGSFVSFSILGFKVVSRKIGWGCISTDAHIR